MVFGTPTKTPSGKTVKPGAGPTRPGGLRPPGVNPNDTSIEGNLRQLMNEQEQSDQQKKNDSPDDFVGDVDGPLVRLVNSLLAEAVTQNASDIHIEPFEGLLRVRYRIDGVLREVQKIPHKLASAINSRLKIMADLDICERRIPQDGSFKFRSQGVEADFRLSTLPSVFGEKVVMRVMGTTNVNNDLSKLGIPADQLKIIRDAALRPDGLVLVTGPTGSGKTTTLYAALNELNDISVSVFTAEDPVEGTLQGVTQCQVNASIGYTFSSILRSLLRQDPDVILVGEIRDQETAEISIKAALTGHLVLSTLHTNCAVSTISRLLNMGIQPYLITTSVSCVVAQRLVRRICVDCKQEMEAPPELLEKLGNRISECSGKMYYGKGCPKCHNSGYKGRTPLYEVLSLSDELRRLVLAGASKSDLKRAARRDGMRTLRESGLNLVIEGITTLDEVLGATNEDDEGPVEIPAAKSVPATTVVETDAVLTAPPIAAHPPATENGNGAELSAAGQEPAAPVDGDDRAKEMAQKWKQIKSARQGAQA